VLDACGNASINDISTVPLINLLITSQGGCIHEDATLKMDSIPGATYSWYKKTSAVDSTLIGNSTGYYIPYITPADTGMYVCKVVLNSGCITRIAYHQVTGVCFLLLDDNKIKLDGRKTANAITVNWKVTNESGIKEYIVERKLSNEQHFTAIAQQAVNGLDGVYSFIDNSPGYGMNSYRIRIIMENGVNSISQVITVKNNLQETGFYTYPNPVKDALTVQLNNVSLKEIVWKLSDINGRVIQIKRQSVLPQQNFLVVRPPTIYSGMYLLSITDTKSNTTVTKKIIFQ
jgi:hypothetical protein